jgi:hypothetical protein
MPAETNLQAAISSSTNAIPLAGTNAIENVPTTPAAK